jgi:cytochrome c553
MRLTWTRLLILAVLGLLGGLLFAWSGLFNVGASTGHWAITDWFLHYGMRQSVETHASGITAPSLDDPALVHRGAGHYASGCAPCHGAPGQPRSPVAASMTPPPPFLPERIPEWQPNELFWIVRHGVKFTGMPAWASVPRGDEVWAMVAFLLRLPDMQPEDYRALALGESGGGEGYDAGLEGLADPFEPVLAECARCHGRDGGGRGVGAFPILAGQSETYLLASLEAFAQGRRHSGIMQPAAAPLTEAQMRRLARHFATAGPLASGPPDAGNAYGEEIARRGVPAEGIPACVSCHEPPGGRYPPYPALRGQTAGYLAQQLRLFRAGIRGGGPFAHIMQTIAQRMTDAQILAAADYFGSDPADRPSRADRRSPD